MAISNVFTHRTPKTEQRFLLKATRAYPSMLDCISVSISCCRAMEVRHAPLEVH